MRYVDRSIRTDGKPAHPIADEGGGDLSESSRFNAGYVVSQQEIHHGFFQVRFEGASQEIQAIGSFPLQLELNKPEIRFNPIKFQTASAEESKQPCLPHRDHEFFR